MTCDKCGSENTEVKTVDKSRHFIMVIHCKDCGEERLPTAKEREIWK